MLKSMIKVFGLVGLFLLVVGCGGVSTLEEYFDRNPDSLAEIREESDAEVAAMIAATGIDMSVEIEIDGPNTLVITFSYGPEVALADNVGELLEAALEMEASTFRQQATEIREAAGVDTVYLVIRYLDGQGTLLAERTFAGQ